MAIDTRQLKRREPQQQAPIRLPGVSANDEQRSGVNLALLGKRALTVKDRMFFTEQLALMLDTGSSLAEAIENLSLQAPDESVRELLVAINNDIVQGLPFSQALARHPEVFGSTYCNLVQASERGGFMVEVLDELLQMDDKRLRLQATMKSALSYPVFLAGFSALVVVFVLLVVFPKFADMFEAIADDLPGTTKMLMALSDSMLAYWPLYLAGIVGVVGAFWGWKHSGAGRETLDKLKLSVPVVRTIYSELYLVQSMRVIGLSLDKGVSVMDTLSSSRDVVDNSVYRAFFRSLEEDVQQGRGLSHGFRQSEYIPDLVKQMVTTGEASGKLPKVLGRVAQYYERQLEQRLQNLSKAAEPVMLLVMGVVVGVLVSSLILPIFQMSRMTH